MSGAIPSSPRMLSWRTEGQLNIYIVQISQALLGTGTHRPKNNLHRRDSTPPPLRSTGLGKCHIQSQP